MCGLAAKRAAEKLLHTITENVASNWEVDPSTVSFKDGTFTHPDHTPILVDDALFELSSQDGAFSTEGHYETDPITGGDYRGSTIGASPAYSITACIAEVHVDEETGVVTPLDIWIAHDLGRVINPTAARGQAEGGAYMTAAEAVMEKFTFDAKTGMPVGPSLLDSPIPTTLDTPRIHVSFVESEDPTGPFGAKEVGEGTSLPVAVAISNAAANATGVRFRTIPMTPDVVLAALQTRKEA